MLEIVHMIWPPNCHQIKAKKHQIFFSYFVENCIEISFLFLKELFVVEIENLLRISKENREKARTEIKILGNPIKNEFGNI